MNSRESVESLGKKIDEAASRVYQAGRESGGDGAGARAGAGAEAVPSRPETIG